MKFMEDIIKRKSIKIFNYSVRDKKNKIYKTFKRPKRKEMMIYKITYMTTYKEKNSSLWKRIHTYRIKNP